MGIRGISRIDSKHTHGWFVRIYRDGKAMGKFFSDGVHGGTQEALQAAREYHKNWERENPADPFRGRVRQRPQRNNKTGVVGISETFERWRNGKKVPCFAVSWCPYPNVPKNKRFYLHRFDSREAALKAAIEFRKEREKEILRPVLQEWQWEEEPRQPLRKPATKRLKKAPPKRKHR